MEIRSLFAVSLLCIFFGCNGPAPPAGQTEGADSTPSEAGKDPANAPDPAQASQGAPAQGSQKQTAPSQPPQSSDVGKAGLVAKPLQPKSAATATQFERLDVAQTGVEFVNAIDKDHPSAYLYTTSMVCGGIAIGDIDGDGLPDAYFTSGPRQNRLYRQTAPFKFEDITDKSNAAAADVWSVGAAFADVDGDGDLDIYVCNFDVPNHLYINDGKGVFVEKAKEFGVDFIGAGHTPSFADYDRDGDLDFYLMTNYYDDPRGSTDEDISEMVEGKPRIRAGFEKYYEVTKLVVRDGDIVIGHDRTGQPDRLVRNNGDGTFSEVSKEAGIEGVGKGNSVTWWDYNEDGWPDIFVANDFQDPDRLYRNNGDGTFTNMTEDMVPHIAWFSMGADFGDIDGDGAPDLIVADMSGTNHFKQKTAMGAMSDSAEFLNTAVPRQYMRNAVFVNSRGGRFIEAAYLTGLANTDWTWTVRLADFDNDSNLDAYFSNGMSRNMNVSDNPEATRIVVGETQWDRSLRAKTPELREQNLAFRNLGDFQFEDVSKKWGLDHLGMSFSSATGDLDGDGDLDMIVCNLDEPASIYRNNSSDGNRVVIRLKGRTNRFGLGSKVTIDAAGKSQIRELTTVRGYLGSHQPIVHFGLGDAETIDKLTVHWLSGHTQTFENVKANQELTITEPTGPAKKSPATAPESKAMFASSKALSKARHSEVFYDDFSRQPLLPNKYSQLGPGLAWGDIDGDGDDDLWIGGARAMPGQIHRNDGKGKFTRIDFAVAKEDRLCEDMGGILFDADSDGDNDLYVVSGGVECEADDELLVDRLYFNDGKGQFTRSEDALPDLRDSGGAVVAADYDHDGDLDLFVGGRIIPGKYPQTPSSRLLNNDGGKFTDVTADTAPKLLSSGLVTSAIWSDYDQDGWADLLVGHEWGPVKLFRNEEGKLVEKTADVGIDKTLGWWNGITSADFDQDGDLDYAVTNFGLNTKYHASMQRPTLLFYGEFEGEGQENIIEAEFEDGTLYPVRGLSCSSNAMPHLLDKFNTYTKFALADLTDIYEPNCLDESIRCEANTLESGVFINEGGKFTFKPFPRLAQVAPGFGIVAGDFSGDGKSDVYLAQNFYSPQAETGRMAGGVSLLLEGKGDGTFLPAAPKDSGLYVGGDAKSLTTSDINNDGRLDFVVGVNDDHIKAFESTQPASKMLTVRLKGKSGNLSAVGATVNVEMSDGSRRFAEVHGGSGYLSQSSPVLQFGLGDATAKTIKVKWPDSSESESPAKSSDVTLTWE